MDQNKAYVMDYHFQTDLFSTYFALFPKQKCKMSQSINEIQRQTILYYWEKGIREAPRIQSLTKIPIRTIYYNLKEIREKGNVKHRGGNGRKRTITDINARRIGQYVRKNPTISTKLIASKLKEEGTVVSRITVGRHLAEHGYKNSLPLTTPMLTKAHKESRVIWAKKHLNDNWKRTVFTDETSFQLFHNTIKHWHKGARPIHPMPKDRRKIMAWGGFCAKGKTSLFLLQQHYGCEFLCWNIRTTPPRNKRTVGRQMALPTR